MNDDESIQCKFRYYRLVLEIISKMEKVLFSKKSLCKMYHKKSF